ncbi:MAG: LysR family transcriptional regulator [Deltaproteobacteria bacterium]|nr:LysR family transcriptional regulator [Deltaproteobacteria bacterium]MBW2015271.1 LysR family transcriptional regulator [Deltaproteobacteria bacterium]MBW2127803.1 LysR family transcriptional regulator [Deltaproteobacteria bacterium]
MQINLNQLRAFYLAARERSITRAADILCITQPAVTMQVKSLEQALDIKLFRKYGKDLRLTEVGHVLFDYVEKIFEIVDEMEFVLKRYSDLSRGSLVLGTTRSFARHLMPRLLSRFQERYPGVKISLKVGSSQEIADGLMAFEYDLGIIGRLPHSDKLKVIPYTREEFCLITPPQHRFAGMKSVSLKDLKDEPIIIRENGSGSRYAMLSLLETHGITPSVLVEAGSVEFIKEYVIKGKGVSFLYKPEVEKEAMQGLLHCVCLKEGPIYIQTDIVYPKDVNLSPPAQAFLELAREKDA